MNAASKEREHINRFGRQPLINYLVQYIDTNFDGNQAKAAKVTEPYGHITASHISMILSQSRDIKPEKIMIFAKAFKLDYIHLMKLGGYIESDFDTIEHIHSQVLIKPFPVKVLEEMKNKVDGNIPYTGNEKQVFAIKIPNSYFHFNQGDILLIKSQSNLSDGIHYVLAEDKMNSECHIYKFIVNGTSKMLEANNGETIILNSKTEVRFKISGIVIESRRVY